MLMTQIVGRSLRTAPGKQFALILDHSDNHLRLGFVTDIDVQHTELYKGGDRRSSATDRIRLPKECPSCSFLKPPGTAKCPACGFIAVAHSKIEPTPGELKELKRKEKEAKDFVDPRVFYSELLAYASMKGYNPGWVAHKYQVKFGKWPNGMRDVASAVAVSDKTESWIRSQQIRWVKSKGYQQPRQHRVDIEPGP
jgi:superfamily II DNA or RNA helicase